jgi:hypothetical protein
MNAEIDTHWKFMIDNHQLTVIAMDLVPIKPYSTNFINIGMGKRLCKLTRSKSNNIIIFLRHLSITGKLLWRLNYATLSHEKKRVDLENSDRPTLLILNPAGSEVKCAAEGLH